MWNAVEENLKTRTQNEDAQCFTREENHNTQKSGEACKMERVKKLSERTVAYGHDRVPGWFFAGCIVRYARQFLLHDAREFRHLFLHLQHFFAHVQDDFNARKIHSHVAR